MLSLTQFIALAFPICLAAAAITDIRRYEIPNWTSAVLVISFTPCALAAGMTGPEMLEHMLVGAAALAVGFLLFATNIWGAGDGKLIAAAALWFDGVSAIDFLLYTSMVGGLLGAAAIAALAVAENLRASAPAGDASVGSRVAARLSQQVAYGVAIAAGALLAFPSSPMFARVVGL